MRSYILSSLLLASAITTAAAQSTTPDAASNVTVSFRPSVAIVMGIFAIMFTVTFLLLMYAKFCHPGTADFFGAGLHDSALAPPHRSTSGMDKSVIETLPFFQFSHLKGSRDGLECAVCLSRFEDSEILRLLPRCKHAFHIACVDRWLEAHSSCPLCRRRVDADDAAIFKHSSSSRSLLRIPSDRRGGGDDAAATDLELFVEREPSFRRGSSRFTIGGSFGASNNDEALLAPEEPEQEMLHKFKHRIIISDVFFKSRWSDVNSSDLMSLNSDMLNVVSSKRFDPNGGEIMVSDSRPSADERVIKIKEEMERKRVLDDKASRMKRNYSVSGPAVAGVGGSRSMMVSGNRCMSEITNLSRFRVAKDRSTAMDDDKVRRVWLPIARRTVQWFAGREKRSQSRFTRDDTNV